MKRSKPYRILLLLLLPVLVMMGCNGGRKTMNKRVTLWRNDKIPYGAWYAYDNLQNIFPNAKVVINKKSPDPYRSFAAKEQKSVEEIVDYDTRKTTTIIISSQVLPDDKEVGAILEKVGKGEHLFISSLRIGDNLLDTLHLKTAFYTGFYNTYDSLTVSINNPVTGMPETYTYPGMALDNYFDEMDSSITTILGEDEKGRANFVKFSYEGGGAIYIHLAPATFTNFFLLHKDNKTYYDNALSYLPDYSEIVRWDEYFRYSINGSGNDANSGFSATGWIMKQPSLAAGLWLLLVLLLIIYLFESKRRQRIIPVIEPLKNASLDFVKTIGRLYFQRKDNKDLAQKMTVFFLDHVRNRYNIRGSLTDEEFEKRLAYKSGYDPVAIKNMLYYINFMQNRPAVSDEELLRLNQKLEKFYATSHSSGAKTAVDKKLRSTL